jgi:hypothetical protein
MTNRTQRSFSLTPREKATNRGRIHDIGTDCASKANISLAVPSFALSFFLLQ